MDKDRRRLKDESYKSRFKKVLREELCPDRQSLLKLSNHLGITEQSARDIRDGNAFPRTENLFKIAEFYNCSLDYLIGLSDVPSPKADLRAINEKTGLSQKSIEVLQFLNGGVESEEDSAAHRAMIDFINLVLESCERQIENYEDVGGPVSSIFTDMMNYVNAPSARIAVWNDGHRLESEFDSVTVELYNEPAVINTAVLVRGVMLDYIKLRLDYFAERLAKKEDK